MLVSRVQGETPTEYFLHLFTEENLEIITIETNRFMQEKEKNKQKKIKPITKDEVKKVIGILIYMSIVKVPGIRRHFTGITQMPIVANAMKVSRFEEILSNLHFSDNNLQPGRDDPNFDKFYKFRKLLTNFTKSFENSAEPEPHMSVDEMLAPAKGRIPGKVYMPNKPHKRGAKIWAAVGAKSGYVHRIQIFSDNTKTHEVVHPSIGASGRVVLELANKMPKGTHFYFDNYFASPLLLHELLEEGYEGTCTLRTNRKSSSVREGVEEKGTWKYGLCQFS